MSTQIAGGHPDYFGLVDKVTSTVTATVPPSKTVLMVSKGDENLLRLGSRSGWHFPRLGDGRYAGYYPADSADAIEQLEELRARGADYIVFPATSLWWLDHYPELGDHLEANYAVVLRDANTCAIYDLSGQHAGQAGEPAVSRAAAIAPKPRIDGRGDRDPARGLEVSPQQLISFLDVILPDESIVGMVSSGEEALMRLEGREIWHFPRDPSGRYAGHGPANTEMALDQLEGLRGRGLMFLVVPREAPWLNHYPGFIEQVERRYRCVARQRYLCSVYDLTDSRHVRTQDAAGEERSPWRRWFRARSRAGETARD